MVNCSAGLNDRFQGSEYGTNSFLIPTGFPMKQGEFIKSMVKNGTNSRANGRNNVRPSGFSSPVCARLFFFGDNVKHMKP